jgi:N-acetylglucosaminyldiphosphoundecaprenol N-acetyl-beta-D-mannosaminyltransferase
MNINFAIPFINILDTRIDNLTMGEVLGQIEKLIALSTPSHIITANVDHLVMKRKGPDIKEIFRNAALILPDGVPLLWAARFLRTPLQERINGTDLMEKTCELAAQRGYSVFFLGGEAGIAEKLAAVMPQQFSGLNVAGTYTPYFGFENDAQENEKICHLLKEKKPDILFSSLGFPKGIKWIDKYFHTYEVPLAIEVGASFMFISGQMKRAPRWMQKYGFEWFWRLLHEPRRLWKRYLLRDLTFFYHILKQKLCNSKSK